MEGLKYKKKIELESIINWHKEAIMMREKDLEDLRSVLSETEEELALLENNISIELYNLNEGDKIFFKDENDNIIETILSSNNNDRYVLVSLTDSKYLEIVKYSVLDFDCRWASTLVEEMCRRNELILDKIEKK
jgi:hypothetical protein